MTLSISFEVFPPKNPEGLDRLASVVGDLGRLRPAFVSVTFGAGGSSCDRSFAAIETAARHAMAPVAGHLTCVAMSISDVDGVIDRYAELGIDHIVALRGDPPSGIDARYVPHPEGYQRTADLVAAIKRRGHTEVSVSAYPEVHPQSPDLRHDLDVLAAKVDAGADRAITQMFFDNEVFLRYRERVRSHGIHVPLVPGIFPIHSFDTVSGFAERCGATIPSHVGRRFVGLDEDPAAARAVGATIAAEQIAHLAANGVEHFHLYTLNRADLALQVCDLVGVGGKAVA